jgi:hypothetical protein
MLLLVRRHRVLLSLRHLHRRRPALRRAAASADNPDAQISHPIGPSRGTIASEETTRATAGTGTWRGTGARGGADGGGNAPALPLLDQPGANRWMRAASVWKTKRMAGLGRVGGREERVAGNANEPVHRPLVSYEGVMGSVAACYASFKSHLLHACSSTRLLPVTVIITMAKTISSAPPKNNCASTALAPK